MKKWSVRLLPMILVFALLAGCSNQNETDQTNQQDGAEPSISGSDTVWYELEPDSGILTARLPDEKQDFTWTFVIDDESILEMLTQESIEDQHVVSFRALADGETQVTFTYSCNDELSETRVMELRCKDGKVTEILSDGVMDMTGAEDDAGDGE